MSSHTATSVQAIEWSSGLEDSWSSIASFIPKLIAFLIVVIIGWIVAKIVARVLGKVLEKVGFGRLLDKAGLSRFFAQSSFTPITLICKLIYYFILLIALQLGLTAFGPSNPVSTIINDIVAFLPKAVVAIVIVVIVAAIANAVKDILRGVLGGVSYGNVLTNIVGVFIVALGVIAALNQVGIATTVTMPVLITVLATIGGVLVVGVGGGLIGPMRSRWEGWLDTLEAETGGSSTASSSADAGHDDTGRGYNPSI
ncbi:MAG: mechanosensitive ion channel family protein [Nocardioidaceae bacterium]